MTFRIAPIPLVRILEGREVVAAAFRKSMSAVWPIFYWQEAASKETLLGAFDRDMILGVSLVTERTTVHVERPKPVAHWEILVLGVLPNYQGKGIGSALILASKELISPVKLHVTTRRNNQRAIKLYKHHKLKVWLTAAEEGVVTRLQ